MRRAEICIRTNVLFSVFLLYLPHQGDHVCSPSVGSESTLAFWPVYLWCRQDEVVQLGNASVVWTEWFFSLVGFFFFFNRGIISVSLRSCDRVLFSVAENQLRVLVPFAQFTSVFGILSIYKMVSNTTLHYFRQRNPYTDYLWVDFERNNNNNTSSSSKPESWSL